MCEWAVEDELSALEFVPNLFKTQNMCEKAREMCTKAVEKYPYNLAYVPDYFKTPETYKKAVEKEPYFLKYVLDCFVTREWIDMSRDHCYDDDDGNHSWYDWDDKNGTRAFKNVRLKKQN